MELAGLVADLTAGLNVTISDVGHLTTFGAVVLCVGSPLMVWATSEIDRHKLLIMALAGTAIGQFASAFVPDYGSLLAIRLVMMMLSAVYTPVAASTVAMIVAEKSRASAISFVFLGWSLAIALGLPVVTFLALHVGWRETFAILGGLTALVLVLTVCTVPSGLRGGALSLRNWASIGQSPLILLLLLITALWTSGMFTLFPYLGPLVVTLANGSAREIGVLFAIIGMMGFIGNIMATRIVVTFGAFTTARFFLLLMFAGMLYGRLVREYCC